MGFADVVTNIEDLEKLYYTEAGNRFLNKADLRAPFIHKAEMDNAMDTSDTGVYQARYGAQVWAWLNLEANVFGSLPKMPWVRSGWRAITARASSTVVGGIAETGAIPAPIIPTFAQLSTKPKLVAHTFTVTEIQEFLASQSQDDAVDMAFMRAYMGREHVEHLNKMLMTQNGTLASNNIESVDRVCTSTSEIQNCKENDESTSYTAADGDIYSQDRDSSSTADAYVNHNSSTVRALTDTLIKTLIRNTLTNWANPAGQFFVTGLDTNATLTGLYDDQVRYNPIGNAEIQMSVNGIQTSKGLPIGLKVATLYGSPIILSKNTVVDTGGISRLYLLDASNPEGFDYPRLFIKVAKPTQYFEWGINKGTPGAYGYFADKGMFRFMGELVCSNFTVQGKIRDLS